MSGEVTSSRGREDLDMTRQRMSAEDDTSVGEHDALRTGDGISVGRAAVVRGDVFVGVRSFGLLALCRELANFAVSTVSSTTTHRESMGITYEASNLHSRPNLLHCPHLGS